MNPPYKGESMLNKELFTIPNLLTLSRIGLIPVYVPLYLRGDHFSAGCLLALSCLTDLADGWIARRFHMTSDLGKVLDPLADKLTQLALFLCLVPGRRVPGWVLGLFLTKEIFQLAAGFFCLRRGGASTGTLPAGKVCTAVLFSTLTTLVIFPDLPAPIVRLLSLLDAAVLAISLVSYLLSFLNARKSGSH